MSVLLPRFFIRVTVLLMLIGVAAFAEWQWTGNAIWIRDFFRFPGAAFMVLSVVAETALCYFAYRQFAPSEPMHLAWFFLTAASSCRLIGTVIVQIIAFDASEWLALREAAFVINGPIATSLIGIGLWRVLRAYREIGWAHGLKLVDWLVLSAAAVECMNHFRLVLHAIQVNSPERTLISKLTWLTDPILFVVLALALLLRRAVMPMSGGWLAWCWGSYAAGVFFTSMGDLGLWAQNYGIVPYPWFGLTWFIWLPAAAAFALGPMYQWVAIREATDWAEATPLSPRSPSHERP
jgi:hypothetical protein